MGYVTIYPNDNFLLNRFASTNGLPSGTKSAIGNYSDAGVGQTDFYIEALDGEKLAVARVIIHVVDSGSFDSGAYGNGIILTNGIKFIYTRDGVELDVSNGYPIKTNVDWGRFCFDVNVSTYGAGNEALSSRWSFDKYGNPIVLNKGDRLTIRFNDDFTDLVDQTFLFEGVHLGTPNPSALNLA
jgi:hypothetical protein